MANLINNHDNIIDMEIFVKNFNNIKMHKKLKMFNIININEYPIDLPILKPTLNISEQELSIDNLGCGHYVNVKSRILTKIIVYRDLDGRFWEIAMKNDNSIIDIEPFIVNGYDGITRKNDKVSEMVDELIELNNKNIYSFSIFTPTVFTQNVFNCINSPEYKMILYAILNCKNNFPVSNQQYVKNEELVESIKLFSKIINNNWKVIKITSINLSSHIFITCDDKQQIWMIVTDWLLDNVTDVFPIILKN